MNGTSIKPVVLAVAPELALMAGAAVVLALLGPFGTWAMPVGRRLLIWSVFAFGGYACFRPVILAGDALSAQSSLPRWLTIAIACLLASMPTTVLVAGIFSGFHWEGVGAGYLVGLYPQILVVGGAVTAIQYLLSSRRVSENVFAANPDPISTSPLSIDHVDADDRAPTLLDQLPPHLGRDILCVENEDHYVRVHTGAGSALILMRLRDAIAQLAEIDGEQVHRSWWVARASVTEVIRSDRRVALRLSDGREVPVARSAIPVLRKRGWVT